MLSIILRKDDSSYDIIPNTWMKTEDTAYYPNVNFRTKSILVKSCAKPEVNSEEIGTVLVKTNIDW